MSNIWSIANNKNETQLKAAFIIVFIFKKFEKVTLKLSENKASAMNTIWAQTPIMNTLFNILEFKVNILQITREKGSFNHFSYFSFDF